LLKRRFPHLVWVADFRDLHVDPVLNNVVWPSFQKRCNRWVLRRADVVSTVSEGLKASLREVHGNVVVLRNGIGQYEKTALPPYRRFTISYTGSLYPGLQNPLPLFKALQRLVGEHPEWGKKLQLRYAGKDHLIWRKWVDAAGLSSIAHTDDYLPLAQAREIQQRSHLNLLLSWSQPGSRGVLTCKLYEYMAAGRPVLGLVNGEGEDELESYVAPLPGSFYHAPPTPQEDLTEFLYNSIMNWEENIPPPSYPEVLVAPYLWEVQMEHFVNRNLPKAPAVSTTDYHSA